jgi:ComF family protein
MLAAILDFLLPPVCLGCEGAILSGDSTRLVCRLCRSRLRPLPHPACPRCGAPALRTGRVAELVCGNCESWPPTLRSARSAFLLHPPADRLVHQLKYQGWHALARVMGEWMAQLALPTDVVLEARLVVPVPASAARMRERGYNQAHLIAEAFASRSGREVAPALVRGRARRSQTTLQPASRRANVAGAFRVNSASEQALRGQHLILIDDVLTTGATAVECTLALIAAGARAVSVVTFARALDARRLTGI